MIRPKSIAEHIDCLSRLTGAPEQFIGQVRELFCKKGISLDEDATPYLKALDEAFLREESIRSNASAARRKIERLRSNFERIEKSYQKQLDRLRSLQRKLQSQDRRITLVQGGGSGSRAVEVSVPGDHRTYVTRPQRETMPLVPGPKDPQ